MTQQNFYPPFIGAQSGRFYRPLMRFLILLLTASACALAQTNATDAALDGYVHDERAGSITSAEVISRNLLTNQQFSARTNDAGYFRFGLLQIGEYELSVSAPG